MMRRWSSLGFVLLVSCAGDDGNGSTSVADTTDGTTTNVVSEAGPTSMTATTAMTMTASATATTGTASTGPADTGSTEDGSGSSGSTGGLVAVPTPCDKVSPNFEDLEPNDTPDQAIDGCTVFDGYWGNLPGGSTIGGADVVDFVVFQTQANGGADLNVPVTPCWTPGPDLLDVYLYEVVGGMADLSTPIYESVTPDTTCEGETVMLAENSVFLLELRATRGVAEEAFSW